MFEYQSPELLGVDSDVVVERCTIANAGVGLYCIGCQSCRTSTVLLDVVRPALAQGRLSIVVALRYGRSIVLVHCVDSVSIDGVAGRIVSVSSDGVAGLYCIVLYSIPITG